MSKIDRSENNIFPWPKGAYIRNKSYVYINTSNRYISPSEKKEKGTRGYTGHESVCIGVTVDPSNLNIKQLYANPAYRAKLVPVELPDPPKMADSLAVGLKYWIAEASDQSGLTADLTYAFGETETQLILDLTAYMLSKESAVMQHFPAWAREHELFSADIRDDTFIGQFLKNTLTIPRIRQFREKWAVRNIGDGRVFLCYDSTNVNSQAEGVFIVQKGHAKDDPGLAQVNTDYVIRQSDGLPLTYLHSPGSVTDIAQASEMIRFISHIKCVSGKDINLCLICDRGYISEPNLKHMDEAGIEYLLMLRTNFFKYDELADSVIDFIKSYKYELQNENGDERYGVTRECTLYKDGPTCTAQIIWSAERYSSKREKVKNTIATERKRLETFIAGNKGKSFEIEELEWVPPYFRLQLEKGEPKYVERKKRERGGGTRIVEIETVKVTGYVDDETEINRLFLKAGIMVTISRMQMTAQQANDAYAKRDCVEKTFEALKSHPGMDKIGVTTEEAMHGKGLVWFVASVLHALLFTATAPLRATDRKHFTVPAMIDLMEAIKADKNLATGKRERRYKLTSKQHKVLHYWDINERTIDERIADIDV